MSKESKLIPELRFPEFVNDGEWVVQKLESIFDFQDGYPFKSNVFTTKSDKTCQVIRITDINNCNKNPEKVFISQEIIQKLGLSSYSVKNGDLLLSLTGAAGFNFYIWKDGEAFLNQRTMKISPKDGKYENLKILLNPLIHTNINSIGTGQNNNLSKELLREVTLPIPKPEEQQKIAACLSSLDELITTHNEKLEALKDHKKGLMQNLFPQEGETVPKIRFPEFEGDGEWVEKKLGPLTTKVGSGKTPKGGESNYRNAGRPFVRSQNIGWGVLLLDDMVHIEELTHSSFLSSEIRCNDVLLNITGASIGRSAIADERIEGGNVNQHVCIIRPKKDINPVYLNQYIISNDGQKQIDSFQAGGNRQGLNFNQIRSLSIPVPRKVKEQQKIAACLSAVDNLITAQQEKIEQLQQHKKGLMQGMFPKIEN